MTGESRPRVVRVVPDVPAIHRRFDYSVPGRAERTSVAVGSRVRIPLHGRRVAAWVVEDDVTSDPGVHPIDLAASSGLGPPAVGRGPGRVGGLALGRARVVVPRARHPPLGWSARSRPTASTGGGPAVARGRLGGTGGRRPSPPGGPSVVRLAPALDSTLLVLELIHRIGPDGVLVVAAARSRADHLAARLRSAGVPVALLPDDWAAARSGGRVVIGTRAGGLGPDRAVARRRGARRPRRGPPGGAGADLVGRGRGRSSGPVGTGPRWYWCQPVPAAGGDRGPHRW